MSYFNTISMGMGAMFVRGISEIAELRVSLRRLQSFLMHDEYESVRSEAITNGVDKHIEATRNSLTMENVSAKWNRDNSDLALDSINLNVHKGNLIGIIGPVGSGKSSLLQTILGQYYQNYLLEIF